MIPDYAPDEYADSHLYDERAKSIFGTVSEFG